MRRGRLIACALPVLALLAGCLGSRTTGGMKWALPFAGPVGPDVVILEIAVLEVPAGDRYVNAALWTDVDDQVLSPELRQRLEDNGLRIAKVSGRPPDGLQDLLTSERSNRNGRSPRVRSTNATNVPLGPQHDTFQFQLAANGKEEAISFEQAQCNLQVTPTILADGKVNLQFLPQVQHADRKKQGQLIPTIALALQGNRDTDGYPALRWEVPLELNEYVLVGTRFDKPESLGFQFFVSPEGVKPTQRLLAVRLGADVAPKSAEPTRAVPISTAPLSIP